MPKTKNILGGYCTWGYFKRTSLIFFRFLSSVVDFIHATDLPGWHFRVSRLLFLTLSSPLVGCVVLRDVAIPQTDQVHGQNWRDSESGCPSSSFHIISQHVLLPPASTDTIHSQSWRPPTLVKLRLGWHRASRDVKCCRCLRWRPAKNHSCAAF